MSNMNRIMARIIANLHENDPVVLAVGYMLEEVVAGTIADRDAGTDTGYGFGEFCIDTTVDGQAVRVVVSRPESAGRGDAR